MTPYENRFYARTEQPVVLFARIENAENGELLDPSDVTAITLDAWGIGSLDGRRKSAVPGHQRVALPLSTLLSQTVTSVAFPLGYNYRFAPNVRTKPLFPQTGLYEVVIKIELNDQNPIVLTYRFEVE